MQNENFPENSHFKVDRGCMETSPCQHYVTYRDQKSHMDGQTIYQLYVQYNLPVPDHFAVYGQGQGQTDELLIKVDDTCLESYPCQHTVSIFGEEQQMDGVQIFNLYKDNGLQIPDHFIEYAEGYTAFE